LARRSQSEACTNLPTAYCLVSLLTGCVRGVGTGQGDAGLKGFVVLRSEHPFTPTGSSRIRAGVGLMFAKEFIDMMVKE
jgi:hypothetical protein